MDVSANERKRRERWRRGWNKQAPRYDRSMGRFDRWVFGNTRPWLCQRASGEVLEVAVGTGLNLPHYPPGIHLTGIDLSPAMLELARQRAADLDMKVVLNVGNAEALDAADGSFDTVVCTFGLCAIPDHHAAITEMIRVLRPGGLLLLADHVPSTNPLLRGGQWLTEKVTIPVAGEHFLRRPFPLIQAAGLVIEAHQRFAAGIVERFAARRPIPDIAA
jgi:ubiquinone/menaquinone biosynthesis C-methylase UbiE